MVQRFDANEGNHLTKTEINMPFKMSLFNSYVHIYKMIRYGMLAVSIHVVKELSPDSIMSHCIILERLTNVACKQILNIVQ